MAYSIDSNGSSLLFDSLLTILSSSVSVVAVYCLVNEIVASTGSRRDKTSKSYFTYSFNFVNNVEYKLLLLVPQRPSSSSRLPLPLRLRRP